MEYCVIVTGGGWGGCAAALESARLGVRTILLERTDMLPGTGLAGGIMKNNGRLTAEEEMKAMGGGRLFEVTEENARHRQVNFPGHSHAMLYDVGKISGAVERCLGENGAEVVCGARVAGIRQEGEKLLWVETEQGQRFEGDVFVDATGTAGPMSQCRQYGNGCAMCVLRCPAFGGRVSLCALAGVQERAGRREEGAFGSMSGSCKLLKESLSPEIQKTLAEKGTALVPVPKELREEHLAEKACQQYALRPFAENLILLDTGHAKLMAPWYPLHKLRQIPGMENARFEDPYAGGRGNSVRFLAMAPRENTMQVTGKKNLFCAGEKAGPMVGHTEAIVTGTLAGYNAVRYLRGEPLLTLPDSLACGDLISCAKEALEQRKIPGKWTFSGSVYWERMKQRGLYTVCREEIEQRVEKAGLRNVFAG